MATLNIKNFPDHLHKALAERAERDRRSVAQEVIVLLEEAIGNESPHSILELAGLGAEQWRGIDPVEHVESERSSWDS